MFQLSAPVLGVEGEGRGGEGRGGREGGWGGEGRGGEGRKGGREGGRERRDECYTYYNGPHYLNSSYVTYYVITCQSAFEYNIYHAPCIYAYTFKSYVSPPHVGTAVIVSTLNLLCQSPCPTSLNNVRCPIHRLLLVVKYY